MEVFLVVALVFGGIATFAWWLTNKLIPSNRELLKSKSFRLNVERSEMASGEVTFHWVECYGIGLHYKLNGPHSLNRILLSDRMANAGLDAALESALKELKRITGDPKLHLVVEGNQWIVKRAQDILFEEEMFLTEEGVESIEDILS